MDYRSLRAFVAVVREGGFSKAAKVLFVTQSTLSKAVKRLEHQLGLLLLERIGHRIKLTAAGEIVYRRAASMLVDREGLMTELNDLSGLKTGVLRLGFSLGSSLLLASQFAGYRRRYPGIDVGISVHGNRRLQELLLAGELDLATMLLPLPRAFEWEDVYQEPLVVLMSKHHPLANERKVRLKSLASSPFVLLEEDSAINRAVLDACKRRGVTPRIEAHSRQIDFVVELVALGLGVAFLPRMLMERRHHPSIRYAILDEPKTEWHIALAWRRGAYLSAAARAWLAQARETRTLERPELASQT
jgi:DNA-binding transcriptional LysR family regulator